MTAHELVVDTIKYYHGHPERRAANSKGQCEYFAADGNRCAVGRWLSRTKLKEHGIVPEVLNGYGSLDDMVDFLAEKEISLDSVLKSKVSDIPAKVWDDLQSYHDLILMPRKQLANKPTKDKWEKGVQEYEENLLNIYK